MDEEDEDTDDDTALHLLSTHPRNEKIAWEHGCEVKSLPPSLHSPTHSGGEANSAGDKTFKPRPESRKHAQTRQAQISANFLSEIASSYSNPAVKHRHVSANAHRTASVGRAWKLRFESREEPTTLGCEKYRTSFRHKTRSPAAKRRQLNWNKIWRYVHKPSTVTPRACQTQRSAGFPLLACQRNLVNLTVHESPFKHTVLLPQAKCVTAEHLTNIFRT